MGAGSDDLEAGRAFLAAQADGRPWDGDAPDLYPYMVGVALVAPVIEQFGTPAQKERWLPTIRNGDEIWCQLFSEPDAGSDLASLSCRAVRDGDQWRVTGSKVWSSRAHYSKWGLLLARTDPSAPKHAGITAFGVDMTAAGVEVRPLRQMNGDTHFNEVFLTDVLVEDGWRIGAEGEGWSVATATLMHERGSIGGGYGIRVDEVAALARSHGVRPGTVEYQRVASVIADLEVSRLTVQRARAAAEAGRVPGPEGSGSKLRMSSTFKALGDLALDLAGPAGVVGEDDWLTFFLTGPSLSIRGGTDEIQRNIVGERVLGLPREPKPKAE